MQIFADVTGRRIEAVVKPQDAGAIGAALAVPLGLGVYKSYAEVRDAVKVRRSFDPDPSNRAVYDTLFESFQELFLRLSPAYKRLNKS
jgi:xylulokinase